jgi:hypothetical protein
VFDREDEIVLFLMSLGAKLENARAAADLGHPSWAEKASLAFRPVSDRFVGRGNA